MNSIRAVWVIVCVVVFSLSVGAFSSGPPPNRNGVSGVFCTACHRTNELNSGEGSVRIVGLPSAWLPGETFTLQVIVSHPTALRFGFEFSATGANGDQAGDLIPASDGRTFVQVGEVNGKPVQFIEHNSVGSTIGSSNIFQFTYRTPADGSFGPIRFNVAGNAANGNGANTGDFIYATETTVPALLPSTERQFVLATRGGVSTASAGSAAPMAVGFARMQTSSGTAGSGLAFISYRHGGSVLVSEPGFSASAPIRSGRIYAEVGGAVNTGIALANPGSQAASVSFYFADSTGTNFADSSITIPANSQIAAFLNEAPFLSPTFSARPIADARTFTFSSSVPISAAAVRTRLNERGEFMMSALPVADLSASSTAATSIPHMADGGGWSTEVLLVNNSDAVETGTLRFLSPSGQNLTVTLDGQAGNQFTYSIAAKSSRRFRTAGTATASSTGWIEVAPSGNTRTPLAAGVLSARANNITSSETAISAQLPANAFRIPAELSGNFTAREARSTQTGVAISNPALAPVNVSIEATNLDGSMATSTSLSIPARGQIGLLLADIPGLALPVPFTGTVWVSAPAGSSVSVAGLRARYNERQSPDLLVTVFPAFDESAPAVADSVFPQIADSAGFLTKFMLMGVRGGQSSGSLRFFSQAGQPLQLPVR
jgi:hypothetical protein